MDGTKMHKAPGYISRQLQDSMIGLDNTKRPTPTPTPTLFRLSPICRRANVRCRHKIFLDWIVWQQLRKQAGSSSTENIYTLVTCNLLHLRIWFIWWWCSDLILIHLACSTANTCVWKNNLLPFLPLLFARSTLTFTLVVVQLSSLLSSQAKWCE